MQFHLPETQYKNTFADMLSFRILADNRIGNSCGLMPEHGLSIYIQYNGTNILCDTGASHRFISNAAYMDIRLSETDLCFISHGHSDHTGGLAHFLKNAPEKCRVYLSGQIKGNNFYSCRRGVKRDIGTDPAIFEKYADRLTPVVQSLWIDKDIAIVKITHAGYPKPIGNSFLSNSDGNNEFPDKFSHELALAIRGEKGVVIFSPCTHNGIFNVIESCMEFTGSYNLVAFVGGLHIVDGCEKGDEIASIGTSFITAYPHAKLYTGHCTCDFAIEILEKSMGTEKFEAFSTGGNYQLCL